jgi:hypothetical protein
MPTRVQGLKLALGSAKQANISTPSATYIRIPKLNSDLPFLQANTENNAAEIGKGHEFATDVFLTNKEPAANRIEKQGSVEMMLWSWGYALGKVDLATGLYTIHPIDPGVTIELPMFSVAAILNEGGGQAVDELHIGNVVESVETTFTYGPGRDSVRTVVDIVGSGISLLPSAVTMPAVLTEKYARSSGMACTVLGVNYVSEKNLLSGSFSWRNNHILPMRYTPGSGYDADGFAVGNRIFIGERTLAASLQVFLHTGSLEYAKLVAQTEGVSTITLTFDATHFITWTFNRSRIAGVDKTNEQGLVCVNINLMPLYDETVVSSLENSVVVVTGKCNIPDVAQ